MTFLLAAVAVVIACTAAATIANHISRREKGR